MVVISYLHYVPSSDFNNIIINFAPTYVRTYYKLYASTIYIKM